MRATRILTVAMVVGLAVFGLAGPALAHVGVSADKTTAGASDVTLTFTGEAENPAAGIQSERVVLPAGIPPASVTLVRAPGGWKFTLGADGFTVGGQALKAGTDAVWKVRIAKLPDGQTRLSFKTLETYGNGDVSRWIEIQQPGQPEPDNPAPLVTLKPGPPGVTASSPAGVSSPAPEAAVSPAPVASTPVASKPAADQGSSRWWIWLVVGALVVVALGAAVIRGRRRGSPN